MLKDATTKGRISASAGSKERSRVQASDAMYPAQRPVKCTAVRLIGLYSYRDISCRAAGCRDAQRCQASGMVSATLTMCLVQACSSKRRCFASPERPASPPQLLVVTQSIMCLSHNRPLSMFLLLARRRTHHSGVLLTSCSPRRAPVANAATFSNLASVVQLARRCICCCVCCLQTAGDLVWS